MARPVDADSAETFDAIVRAALAIIHDADRPVDLSLRKVAAEAGLSLGTIQYYFRRKEDLLEACLSGYYERLTELGKSLMAGTDAPDLEGRAFVEHVIRRLYRFLYRERRLAELRLVTNAKRGELHPERQAEFLGSIIGAAARALEPHIEVSLIDARLAVQTMAVTMVRLALLTDSEVRFLTGLREGGREAVEEYVVRAGRRLVRPSDG